MTKGIALLERLATTPGVPGREHRIRAVIEEETADLFDSIETDAMGSLHGVIHPRPAGAKGKKKRPAKQPTKVMLAAHMDQIGFLVRHVDAKGFAWVSPFGGFDTRNLFARVVKVVPDVNDPSLDLVGVMNPGGRPVHIATPEDRKKVPEVNEFFVDFGLPADEVKSKVTVGSMVTILAPLYEIGNTVVSQCLDNRVACWVLIEALRKLKKHACEIHAVFTVQEEVGLRGAGTAAFGVQPDIGVALDTTLCCDTPGVPDSESVTRQGAGAGINVADGAAIVDLDLLNDVEAVAKRKKIKHQRTLLHRGGTDAGTMQRAGAGVKVVTLLTPTRYIHTVTETIHKSDMNASRDLVAAYLESVK
ncbi:MAG: M20/M25/M40 family metallo-hydrolase [Planctomycetota bacterium]